MEEEDLKMRDRREWKLWMMMVGCAGDGELYTGR